MSAAQTRALIGLILAACLAGIVQSSHASQSPTIPDSVIQAYARAYSKLKSYRYKYTCVERSLIGAGELEQLGVTLTPQWQCEVAAMNDRLWVSRPSPPTEGSRQGDVVVKAFDGTNLTERPADRFTTSGVARSLVRVLEKERFKSHFIDAQPLDWCLLGFQFPALPNERSYRANYRVPEIFDEHAFTVVGSDRVDGHECLLISSPRFKLWLDSSCAYAVRKREAFIDGRLTFIVKVNVLEQVTQGLWIPKQIDATTLGNPRDRNDRVGKPLLEKKYVITEFILNPVMNDGAFSITPAPGEWVNDMTRRPVDNNGNAVAGAGVSYIQPADKSRLDQVIASASREQGLQPASRGPSTILILFVILNALIVLILAFIVISRRRRRQPG